VVVVKVIFLSTESSQATLGVDTHGAAGLSEIHLEHGVNIAAFTLLEKVEVLQEYTTTSNWQSAPMYRFGHDV
jgi:hypothetical protein